MRAESGQPIARAANPSGRVSTCVHDPLWCLVGALTASGGSRRLRGGAGGGGGGRGGGSGGDAVVAAVPSAPPCTPSPPPCTRSSQPSSAHCACCTADMVPHVTCGTTPCAAAASTHQLPSSASEDDTIAPTDAAGDSGGEGGDGGGRGGGGEGSGSGGGRRRWRLFFLCVVAASARADHCASSRCIECDTLLPAVCACDLSRRCHHLLIKPADFVRGAGVVEEETLAVNGEHGRADHHERQHEQ